MKRNQNPSKDPEKIKEKKEKKEARDHNRKRSEIIKKYSWRYGLGFAATSILLLCVYSLFTISRASIITVALDNADQMKEVFFGGEPWVLQCIDENVTVSPSFVTAAKKISVTTPSIRFGVINCTGKLPSNRTVLERFKMPTTNLSNALIGMLFANGDPPKLVPAKYVLDPKKLALWVEKYSEPGLKELAWASSFKKHCLNRDKCVMIFSQGKFKKPAWMASVMRKHRRTPFVTINRKNHKTGLDDKVGLGKESEAAAVAVLVRTEEGGAHSYHLFRHRGEMNEAGLAATLAEAAKGKAGEGREELGEEPWFDQPPRRPKRPAGDGRASPSSDRASQGGAADRNREWRERLRRERQERRRDAPPDADSAGGKRPGGDDWTSDDPAEASARGRRAAGRRTEEQVFEDNEVVVSDVEDEEDSNVI